MFFSLFFQVTFSRIFPYCKSSEKFIRKNYVCFLSLSGSALSFFFASRLLRFASVLKLKFINHPALPKFCCCSVKLFPIFVKAAFELHPIQISSFCSFSFSTFVKFFFQVIFSNTIFHSLFCSAMCFLHCKCCKPLLRLCVSF